MPSEMARSPAAFRSEVEARGIGAAHDRRDARRGRGRRGRYFSSSASKLQAARRGSQFGPFDVEGNRSDAGRPRSSPRIGGGAKDELGFASMNRAISQGQAMRSILGRSRVIPLHGALLGELPCSSEASQAAGHQSRRSNRIPRAVMVIPESKGTRASQLIRGSRTDLPDIAGVVANRKLQSDPVLLDHRFGFGPARRPFRPDAGEDSGQVPDPVGPKQSSSEDVFVLHLESPRW